MSLLADTNQLIESQAACHDAVVVALDGKDSMTVMDLCAKTFKRIEGFCMVYAFGTERFKEKAAYVKVRWNVDLKEVEHYGVVQAFRRGHYCLPRDAEGPARLKDAIEAQRQAYGIPLIATGTRAAESLGRSASIRRGTWPGWHPIASWRKADVLAYMKHNNIPLPDGPGDMQGISLDKETILRLYDGCRGDYELMRKRFPFIEAVVRAREWYGNAA